MHSMGYSDERTLHGSYIRSPMSHSIYINFMESTGLGVIVK